MPRRTLKFHTQYSHQCVSEMINWALENSSCKLSQNAKFISQGHALFKKQINCQHTEMSKAGDWRDKQEGKDNSMHFAWHEFKMANWRPQGSNPDTNGFSCRYIPPNQRTASHPPCLFSVQQKHGQRGSWSLAYYFAFHIHFLRCPTPTPSIQNVPPTAPCYASAHATWAQSSKLWSA